MIVRFPTGLYKTVLPQEPGDGGNTTYTISNSPPPRTNLLFPKVPGGIVDRKRPTRVIDLFTRRETQGGLIFSVSSASRSEQGNNSRTFEIGQVLEFGDTPLKTVDPMFVSDRSETRHDTNQFDYEALGLTPEEIETISQSSLLAQQSLTDQLNQARESRANAEITVTTQQKVINDTTRNINALQIILDNSDETDPGVDNLIEKFKVKRDEAYAARDAAVALANQYAGEASALQDQLRAVATVVK